jgi:hypothetical protein
MDVANVWPAARFFTLVLGGIAMLDWIVKKKHKSVVFQWFLRVAQVGSRPISGAFYAVVVITSVLLTYGIVLVNARIEVLSGRVIEAPSTQEVIAPLLLGLIFKILVWDYLLALKTFAFLKGLRGEVKTRVRGPARKLVITAPGIIFIMVDFVITVTTTHLVLDSLESFQDRQVQSIAKAEEAKPRTTRPPATPSAVPNEERSADAGPPAQPEPAKSLLWRVADRLGLFDAVDFFSKDTLKLSLCLLNGTSLMYLFMLFSAVARGAVKHLDVEGITTHFFRIMAGVGVICVGIVAVAGGFVR